MNWIGLNYQYKCQTGFWSVDDFADIFRIQTFKLIIYSRLFRIGNSTDRYQTYDRMGSPNQLAIIIYRIKNENLLWMFVMSMMSIHPFWSKELCGKFSNAASPSIARLQKSAQIISFRPQAIFCFVRKLHLLKYPLKKWLFVNAQKVNWRKSCLSGRKKGSLSRKQLFSFLKINASAVSSRLSRVLRERDPSEQVFFGGSKEKNNCNTFEMRIVHHECNKYYLIEWLWVCVCVNDRCESQRIIEYCF